MLQSVDRAALVHLAEERQAHVELLVEVGEYVAVATPIARVHHGPGRQRHRRRRRRVLPPRGRADPDPGSRVRVPSTGRCRHPRLVARRERSDDRGAGDRPDGRPARDRRQRPDPPGWYIDDAGVARLRCREPNLGRLVDLAFIEVIRYGADSPQVVRRLRAAFDVLSASPHRGRRQGRRAPPSARQTRDELMPPAFERISAHPDRHGLG